MGILINLSEITRDEFKFQTKDISRILKDIILHGKFKRGLKIFKMLKKDIQGKEDIQHSFRKYISDSSQSLQKSTFHRLERISKAND